MELLMMAATLDLENADKTIEKSVENRVIL